MLLPVASQGGFRRVDIDQQQGSSRFHAAVPSSPRLLHTVAWGALAECLTSVCCPIVMAGDLDVSATALNISGAFLAGIAYSMQSKATSRLMHASCIAFQAGFVGVFTSFTFLAEQAARLKAGSGHSIVNSIKYLCVVFAAQLAAFAVAIALEQRLPLPIAAAPSTLVLFSCVAVICVWVALSPPGAVSDPLQFDAPHLATTSKIGDALQLWSGLLFQAAGLWLSVRLSRGAAKPSMLPPRALILWAPLRCNLAAAGILLLLRASPCDASAAPWTALEPACPQLVTILMAKICSSGCGALSVSGGLSPALWNLWFGGGRRCRLKSVVNLAIHLTLAYFVCLVLVWRMTSLSHGKLTGTELEASRPAMSNRSTPLPSTMVALASGDAATS
jgi:fluoride ion exporter CrcB/FEX